MKYVNAYSKCTEIETMKNEQQLKLKIRRKKIERNFRCVFNACSQTVVKSITDHYFSCFCLIAFSTPSFFFVFIVCSLIQCVMRFDMHPVQQFGVFFFSHLFSFILLFFSHYFLHIYAIAQCLCAMSSISFFLHLISRLLMFIECDAEAREKQLIFFYVNSNAYKAFKSGFQPAGETFRFFFVVFFL